MPDLDQLADALRADISRQSWPQALDIRAAGERRRRRTRLAVSGSTVVGVAAVAVSAVLLVPGGVPAAGPSGAASSVLSSAPSPSMPPSVVATGVPAPDATLLTADDVAPLFTGVQPIGGPYAPNPFVGCGIDLLPGPDQPVAAAGTGFVGGVMVGGESVLRFEPGAAGRALSAIDAFASGCAGFTRADLTSLTGGDGGILLTSTAGGIVVPEAAHGVALAYTIVRYGDYLVWITLIVQTPGPAPTSLATTLAERAGHRFCAAMGC